MSSELSTKELKKSPDWLTVNKLKKIILSSPSKIESKLYELQYKMPDFIKIISTPDTDLIFLHKDHVNEFMALAGFENRLECALEEKDENWLSVSELRGLTTKAESVILQTLKDLQEIAPTKICKKTYRSSVMLCMHKSYLEKFLGISKISETSKNLEEKSADWLSAKELKKEINCSISVIREKLKELYEQDVEIIKKMRTGVSSIGYCVHKNDLGKFLEITGFEPISNAPEKEKTQEKELPAYTKAQIDLIFGRRVNSRIVYHGISKEKLKESLKKAEELEEQKKAFCDNQIKRQR